MALLDWLQNPRVRRTLAASAVVLATGGLVLFRAPASSGATGILQPQASATQATFAGPGLHGSVGLSQGVLLAGGERDVYAEVRLQADPSDRATVRAPLALAIVLDTSGSMYGEKIEQAKQSVLELMRDMRDDDEIAVIRYSSDVSVVQPLARLGGVRSSLSERVRQIEADGGTAIPLGLRSGMKALEEAGRGRVRRIVLVSDGLDSSRNESQHLAGDSFEHGVTVSSLGIGLDFDEAYMGGVAQSGHGNFGFVKDSPALSAFLERELNETASTTIEGAVVHLRLPHGLRFVSATGADAKLQDETSSGDDVELRFGSLFAKDERRAVLHLVARLDAGDTAQIASDATWTQVQASAGAPLLPAHVDIQPLAVRGSFDSRSIEQSRDPVVLASATSVIASERQLEATQAYARGDVARAQQLIDQNIAS
ncbi:MAG TPA: VWA domain-containing protein, partial [Polyangiaceae bacterium]|nr:VWA domain-containing protein [Polyangiaceae bacterium]